MFYYRVFIVGLISILFLVLPSINNSNLINSTVTSKTIFFLCGIIIISSATLIHFLFSKNKRPILKISIIDIHLIILLAFILINRFIIQSHYGFSIRFIELLGLGILYLNIRFFIRLVHFYWIFISIVVSGIIQAIYGILQLLGYLPSLHNSFNLSGSFPNPGPYAGFLAIVWPVALGMYLFKNEIFKYRAFSEIKKRHNSILAIILSYIPIVGLACIVIILPSTHSRSAWLSVLVSTVFLIFYKYNVLKKISTLTHFKKTVLSISIVLSLSGIIYGTYLLKKDSADGRLLIWRVTYNMIREKPIFGVGIDRFKANYMDAQANYFSVRGNSNDSMTMVADNTYFAFNEVLQFVSENGLLGLLITISLLFVSFRSFKFNSGQTLPVFSLGILIAFFIFSLFSYPSQILPIKTILLLVFALIANSSPKKLVFSWPTMAWKSTKRARVLLFKIVIFMVGVLFSWQSILYVKSLEYGHKGWKLAMNLYQYERYEDSLEEYEKVYPILGEEGDFLRNYGKALVMVKKPEKAIKILKIAQQYLNTSGTEITLGDAYKAIKKYNASKISYQNAANMVPNRLYPHYLLAKLHEEFGEDQKAIEEAKRVMMKEIKIQSTAIQEMKSEMNNFLNKKPM